MSDGKTPAPPGAQPAAVSTGGGQPGAGAGQASIPVPPKTVRVEVDGRPVEADSRDNLIEAARRIGVQIPYFCYHPRLSIAGQCRMCLVETSDAPGRLVPGCQVRVKEGLKVVTTSPAVKENQRGCMEFHLVNHPVDCAICDESGECKLQDYYMEYDHQPTRIRTYKLNKPKREIFGPLVVYDAERCIMCTRCVRFMDEIAQEPQLAVVERGTYSLIATFPGQPLDSKYSGNTVDICPVGALLNRDFRFQSRVWFLNKSPSVCTGCANGCNVYVESRGTVAYRELPRRNEEVNQVWMCDDGRLTHHPVNENRVEWARQGRGEAAESVGPRLAVERAVELLKPVAGKGSIGIYISAQSTNEEAAAALLLGKELGAERYFLGGKPACDEDEFLIRADKNPPCMAVYEQEGSLVNWYGRLQRIWQSVPAQRGDTAPGWLWVTRILEGLGFTHGVKSASAAFELLSGRSAELAELTLTRIPEQGVVLPRLLPAEWPERAPRPQVPAHPRGPQTTPPGTKVGDEASGGSR